MFSPIIPSSKLDFYQVDLGQTDPAAPGLPGQAALVFLPESLFCEVCCVV